MTATLRLSFVVNGACKAPVRAQFSGATARDALTKALLLVGDGARGPSLHCPELKSVSEKDSIAEVFVGIEPRPSELVIYKMDGLFFAKGPTKVFIGADKLDDKLLRTASEIGVELSAFVTRESKQEGWGISVRTMTGKTVSVQVTPDTTVLGLKELLQDKEGIPPDQQRLIFDGQNLGDGFLLTDYGVGCDASLHLVLRLRGGMHHETSGKSDYDTLDDQIPTVNVRIVDASGSDGISSELKNISSEVTVGQLAALVGSKKRRRSD